MKRQLEIFISSRDLTEMIHPKNCEALNYNIGGGFDRLDRRIAWQASNITILFRSNRT